MRPKAVVFIGNGFTISLSHYLGIADWHDTTQLIPPPALWLQEASITTDKTPPLWSESRYPDLWDKWHEFNTYSLNENPTFQAFCEKLSESPAFGVGPNFIGPKPLLHYSSRSPGYQLRRYLWFFFYHYGIRFSSHVCEQAKKLYPDNNYDLDRALVLATADWPLIKALKELATVWQLTIVSFNYDSYLEQVLAAHDCNINNVRVHRGNVIQDWNGIGANVIHPHGELGTHKAVDFESQKPIGDEEICRDYTKVFLYDENDGFNVDFHTPPKQPCPDFPDLVPPGHDEEHLVGLSSQSREIIQNQVSQANMVGIIGFSGMAPDDKEFAEYVSGVAKEARCFSFGLQDSILNEPSYQILSSKIEASNYKIFNVDQTQELVTWLNASFTTSPIEKKKENKPAIKDILIMALALISKGEYTKLDEVKGLIHNLDSGVSTDIKGMFEHYISGEELRHQGSAIKAIEHYQEALALLNSLEIPDDPHYKLYLNVKVASSYLAANETKQARQYWETANKLRNKSTPPWEEIELKFTEGSILLSENQPKAAKECFERCHALCKEAKELKNASLYCTFSGHANLQMGNTKGAKKAYEEAYMWANKNDDKKQMGIALNSIAQFYFIIGMDNSNENEQLRNLNLSIENYHRGFDLCRQAEAGKEMFNSLLGLTQLYGETGYVNEAQPFAQDALKIGNHLGLVAQVDQILMLAERYGLRLQSNT